jgi:hypothetical protein
MAIFQYSVALRNAQLDQIEAIVNPGGATQPILTVRVGAPPANCAAANGAGLVLATITLPADWMANASGGTKSIAGSWQDASADNTGVAGHFRIHDSTGTTCHLQGDVTATGGGGAMTVDNVNFATGQQFTVNTFTITAGNA